MSSRVRPAHAVKYDLLAIDLDGTLLDPGGEVSRVDREALTKARAAGLSIALCTGRALSECVHIARAVEQIEPVIVAGGAIIADPVAERTLRTFPMQEPLVRELVELLTGHGHAALVLKDPSAVRDSGVHAGHDYLVVSPTGEAGIDPVTRWWFDTLNIGVRVVPSIEHDEHPEHTVRVGVCGSRGKTRAAATDLRSNFTDRVTLHHFHAVIPGTQPGHEDDHIVILEAFDASVNKWSAVSALAGERGLDLARIAAIGNDINDIAMLQHAGLGVAMGNAIPEALAVADRTTLTNTQGGVAHAIERILAGEW